MNKKAFVIFLLIAALATLGLGSCLSNRKSDEVRNAKNSLDWEGLYIGKTPLHDGIELNVLIRLSRDQWLEFYYEYVDGSKDPFTWTGKFRWDDTGNIITFEVIDTFPQYRVEKDRLVRLDLGVNNYTLEKVH